MNKPEEIEGYLKFLDEILQTTDKNIKEHLEDQEPDKNRDKTEDNEV